MNGIEILLKAVQDGTLLGPDTFAGVDLDDIDDILNERDRAPFDSAWIRLYKQLKDIALSETEAADLRQLRQKAFLTTDRHFPGGSELSGYISDDFGLIGKGFAANCEDHFLLGLLESYIEGQIPRKIPPFDPGVSLRSLLNKLPRAQ